MSTDKVLYAVSYKNDVRFLRIFFFKKLLSFKDIYSVCNTEEIQI